MSKMLYIWVVLLSVILIGIVIYSIYLLKQIYAPLHFGAIFVPSSKDKVQTMMSFANIKPGERVLDLGSGDGVLIIEAARKKAHCVGVELHSGLVNKSRKTIKKLKLEQYAEIRKENMWKTDVSEYDVVFVYGIVYIMKRLEKKLSQELKPGTRVISNNYKFPTWKPKKVRNNVSLYITS